MEKNVKKQLLVIVKSKTKTSWVRSFFFSFVFVILTPIVCFAENIDVIGLEQPIKQPIELFNPLPDIKERANKTNKPAPVNQQKEIQIERTEKIEKKVDTPVIMQVKENKEKSTTNISAAIEDLKKIADTKWFKFKVEKDVIVVSGMTKKENTKQEIEEYCKEKQLKCEINIVKIK